MKKLMLLIGAMAVLFSACSNEPSENGPNAPAEPDTPVVTPPTGQTFRDVIENAQEGAVIDLNNFRDEDSAYKVKAKNVTLKNANLPDATIVVSDAIGDADFTLEDCTFHSLLVEGGGSNSVHIKGGVIGSLIVSKDNVRVVLEAKVNIKTVNVEVDCALDADNDENTVGSIYINPTVKRVEIGKDENAAISIGEMKFNIADGKVEDSKVNVKLGNDNIKIEKASKSIKDKITDSNNEKVDIGASVEDDKYVKEIPLDISFFKNSNISFNVSGGNVEAECSVSNGEAVITNTSTATDKTLWSSYASMKIPYKGKKDSSYNIKLSLKAAKDCFVVVGVRDAMFGVETGPTYCFKVLTEWKEFEIPTGALFENWSEYAHLVIGVGDASSVYAKNLKIEKTEDSGFPVDIVYNTKDDFEGVTVLKDSNDESAYVINNKAGAKSGVNIFYGVVETGKFYKVSFDVTADADGSFLNVWGHTFHDDYETSGSGSFVFESGKKRHIDLYLPCNAVASKNGSIAVKKCVGQIWIGCKDDKAHSVTVSGINCAESSIAEASQSGLDLYVAGEVLGVENSWTANLNSEPVAVPNGKTFKGQLVLCDAANWGSAEHIVTSFRGISESAKNLGLKKHSDADNLVYTNASGSDKAITLSVDETTFEVNMSVEDVKEFPLAIEQLPYESINLSDEESDNTEAEFSLNDDGGATITNTSAATDKTLWSSFALIKLPYPGKKGSGYNVKLSLRADKERVVAVGVRDAMLGADGPTSYFTLSTEWKEFEIPTGALFDDWNKYAHLSIGVGDASVVYAKDLKIAKVEEPELPVQIIYEEKADVGSVAVEKDENGYTINYKSALAGVNIFYGVVEAGKFYKVSFDITSDADGQFLDIWGHAVNNAFETSGSGSLVFKRGETKHIDLYLPCYEASLKNGNKKHVGRIWIGCKDDKAHSIKVSGIKCAESSIAEARQSGLDLYVAGEVLDVENSWTANLNSEPVAVPNGKTFKGQVVLCDAANWGSAERIVTSFRGISESAKNLGLKKHSDADNLVYTNASGNDQLITLSIDEKTFEVNMSVK